MLWHPQEGSPWLLVGGRAVWRWCGNHFEQLAQLCQFGPDRGPAYGRARGASLLYFDAKTQAPAVAILEGDGDRVCLHGFVGSRAVGVSLRDGAKLRGVDSLAYDTARGVLIHFHCDKARKQVVVFELVEDAWEEMGASKKLYGCEQRWTLWDEPAQRLLVLDERGVALNWDGVSCRAGTAQGRPDPERRVCSARSRRGAALLWLGLRKIILGLGAGREQVAQNQAV